MLCAVQVLRSFHVNKSWHNFTGKCVATEAVAFRTIGRSLYYFSRPPSQSASHPVSQLATQSVSQPPSQSASHLVRQLLSQLASHPTTQ